VPLYDLSANEAAKALLTAKVTGLPQSQQDGQQQTAEALLGLRSPAYSLTDDVEKIVLALVHQMNFQVAQGVDPLFVSASASTHAKQSTVYRDRYINPVAKQLVDEVTLQYATTSRFADTLTSFRTRGGTG
jgi:hypothetical protein